MSNHHDYQEEEQSNLWEAVESQDSDGAEMSAFELENAQADAEAGYFGDNHVSDADAGSFGNAEDSNADAGFLGSIDASDEDAGWMGNEDVAASEIGYWGSEDTTQDTYEAMAEGQDEDADTAWNNDVADNADYMEQNAASFDAEIFNEEGGWDAGVFNEEGGWNAGVFNEEGGWDAGIVDKDYGWDTVESFAGEGVWSAWSDTADNTSDADYQEDENAAY